MDLLIKFIDRDADPADYLPEGVYGELARTEIDWEDVLPGYPFFIEGEESVIRALWMRAERLGHVEYARVL